MLTLGIETSCDETSVAVLSGRDHVLSNVISSSLFRHKDFGGVVPEIASRHSLEQIDTVLTEALSEAKIKLTDIQLIAVTEGPGLSGSLLVGVSFAKALSYQLGLPLVAVNHLEAHLSANFIGNSEPEKFVGLLVSGGHTSLTFHERGKISVMGETVDDAVGEAYDKTAKILGLEYPGGPEVDRLAKKGNPNAFRFTRPKQDNPFNFSFSGIKTAVLYEVKKNQPVIQGSQVKAHDSRLTTEFIQDMCASFQKAVVSWVVEKSLAVAREKAVSDIVVGGGVSANSALRAELTSAAEKEGIRVWFPPQMLTMDNAAMIARRGLELFESGKRASLNLTAAPNLSLK